MLASLASTITKPVMFPHGHEKEEVVEAPEIVMPTKTWTSENVVDDNGNTVRDILTTLWDRSIDGY